MSAFIVNPPIKNDADYYRADDHIVQRILDGESMLVPGLRRAGKTSFLLRVGRAANVAKRKSLFFDLNDFFIDRDLLSKEVTVVANRIQESDKAIILLDEAEVFRTEQKYLKQLLSACREHTFVMTCAPVFVLELDQYSDWIQARVEQLHRHLLGPLSWEEATSLLSQSKRPRPVTLEKDVIEEILRNGDRLPIILQALGAKYVDGVDLYVSLTQFGTRVLMGLTPKAKEAFVLAAHGGEPARNSTEVKLLTALGGLRHEDNGRVTIAGKTLDDVIRESSEPPPIGNEARRITLPAADWVPYTTILHLSDLHFGPHCIEKNATNSQFSRLRSALERDRVSPDFVVVTGDLSWSGHRNELKEAEKFLELFTKWLSKSRRWTDKQTRKRILLLPGNHEAAWTLTNGLQEDERAIWSCYSLAPFASLVHRFHRGDEFWDVERPCHSRCFAEPSLAFISISTSHFITQESKRGQFGDTVRSEVVALLEQKSVKQARFRIGLMHHNLRSFHRDGQVLLDIESAWLHFAKCKPGLDFVLHGHVHQGEVNFFAPREGSPVQYSAVGSFGVRAAHRPGDDTVGRVPNEFAVVYLETNGTGRRFTTQFYELSHTPTGDLEWHAAKRTSSKNL